MKITMKYVTASPSEWNENTFYYHKDGGEVRHILTNGSKTPLELGTSVSPALDVEIIIRAASYVDITKNISVMNERILENPIDSVFIVIDASSHGLSETGVLYVYSSSLSRTIPVSEFASIPHIIMWDELIGAPMSSPAEIDAAVSKKHRHTNKHTLDKWGEDAFGIPLFNGERVHPVWKTTTW